MPAVISNAIAMLITILKVPSCIDWNACGTDDSETRLCLLSG